MATPKKKHLIELMIEAGVNWPVGAEYAAQDKKDNRVHFYKDTKPLFLGGWLEWVEDYECTFIGDEYGITLQSLCRNWHQTIVTREQYAEALAAIGGKTNQVRESEDAPDSQPAAQLYSGVAGVMPSESIEQLTADYYAKAAEADRLQSVADEALKAADDALLALEKAGELLGLVISIDTKQKQAEQPIITDWRDLRVGDVVEITSVHKRSSSHGYVELIGTEATVVSVGAPESQDLVVALLNGMTLYIDGFSFIRRR